MFCLKTLYIYGLCALVAALPAKLGQQNQGSLNEEKGQGYAEQNQSFDEPKQYYQISNSEYSDLDYAPFGIQPQQPIEDYPVDVDVPVTDQQNSSATEPALPAEAVPPYKFRYEVEDEESGNSYYMEQSNNGYVVEGFYEVLLPDGRLQVVTYYDDGSGFNAVVTYE